MNHLPTTPYTAWWDRNKNVYSASKHRRVNVNSVLLEEEIRRISHSSGCPWMMGRSLPSTTTGKGEFWTRQVASWLQNRTEVVSFTCWRWKGRKLMSFPSLVSLQALVTKLFASTLYHKNRHCSLGKSLIVWHIAVPGCSSLQWEWIHWVTESESYSWQLPLKPWETKGPQNLPKLRHQD